jgi:hypothetical protein
MSVSGTGTDHGVALAMDKSDNVFVLGYFQSDVVSVNSVSGTHVPLQNSLASGGTSDIFLTKVSGSDGKVLWATQMGGIGNDTPGGVAVDSNGHVYVVG